MQEEKLKSVVAEIKAVGGITGSSGATAYSASKGGSRIFTKGAAVEFASSYMTGSELIIDGGLTAL